MPRMIQPTATLDTLEDEVMFTIAALGADPDATDLADDFSTWLEQVDAERVQDRSVRQQAQSANARRVVANSRLDAACTAFGDGLYLAVKKDRKSRRWLTFFSQSVSTFVRQPFADQVKTVGGWLSSTDDALTPHRDALTLWHGAANQAIDADGRIKQSKGEQHQRREDFAQRLTNARDTLHDDLSAIARDRGLDRTWADTFFLRT